MPLYDALRAKWLPGSGLTLRDPIVMVPAYTQKKRTIASSEKGRASCSSEGSVPNVAASSPSSGGIGTVGIAVIGVSKQPSEGGMGAVSGPQKRHWSST